MTFTISKPTDILGHIAGTFDYMPQGSIVVLGLIGTQTGATMRLDVPADEWTANRHGRWMGEQLSRIGHDGALVVTFGEHADPEARMTDDAATYGETSEAVARGLLAYGVATASRFHVGGGQVMETDDPSTAEPVAAAVASHAAQARDLSIWELTRTPAQVVDQFEGHHRHLMEPVETVVAADIDAAEALTEWEHAVTEVLVTGDPETITADPKRAADLLAMITDADRRDALLMCMAESRAAADRVINGEALTEREEQVITGQAAGGPDWDRLDRMSLVLSALNPRIIEGGPIEQVHSIMAWLEFVRGAATLAGEYIDRAAGRECLNGFMVTLDELLRRGLHCHWTTERAISWRGVHRY